MKASFVVSVLIVACCLIPSGAGKAVAAETHPLTGLRGAHPRLMLTTEGLASLRERYLTDPVLQRYVGQVVDTAKSLLDAPPLTYDVVGPRLLHVSRECLRRVYALALAYRWTGEEVYANGARDNLLAVCAFKDWNPSHFLDVAEMVHAVSIGYDWLFEGLAQEQRETFRHAIIAHGLEPGLLEYEHWSGWPDSEHNWNQVCNAGLIIGALAVAGTDPEYAEKILPLAVKSLPYSLATYAPDGAWPEGPAYWSYATHYTAYGLCALDTALGRDFELGGYPGMAETGLFPIYTAGPQGLYLNFADSGEFSKRSPMPCMFWLSRRYGNALIGDAEHYVLENAKARPEHVMWYLPPSEQKHTLELDRLFGGPVPVAVFRSAWDDPDALFVGVKGGYNLVNHGHLDLGNFELDALGVRWARDLGSDDYNLPGYFSKGPGGARWNYYRMRSLSHNVTLLNGEDQTVWGRAEIVSFAPGDSAHITLDLSRAYAGQALKASRTVSLVAHRSAVLVEDRFSLDTPAACTWGMTTDAEITIESGQRAVLRQDGKTLLAESLEPADASFKVESAAQAPPEKRNDGVRRLQAITPERAGEVSLRVLLTPGAQRPESEN